MIFVRMFSRRWLFTTLLVLVAMGVMARLGVWQLQRLEHRRAFNTRVQTQLDQPQLTLDAQALDENLQGMEYRAVVVRGEYDFSQEVALHNQVHDGQWGVHLITPLQIEGTQVWVLVDRGWIPAQDYESGDWSKYTEPGVVEVQGMLRASQTRPEIGRRSDIVPGPGEPPLKAWHLVNVGGIDQQVSYDLLPVYVQQAPQPGRTELPARYVPELTLSEGSHLGYAIQWFGFAILLGSGYPFFIRRQEQLAARGTDKRLSQVGS